MAEDYRADGAFAAGEKQLQRQILQARDVPTHLDVHWQDAPDMLRSLFRGKEVPLAIVQRLLRWRARPHLLDAN